MHNSGNFIYMRHLLIILLLLIPALLFFPVLGLIAQFAGNLQLAAFACERSPSWIVSSAEVERLSYEAAAQAELQANHTPIQAGPLKLRIASDADGIAADLWQRSAVIAITELSRLLPGNPPMPTVETRKLYDNYGRMDSLFYLAVDPSGDEPLRTMAHELTHLYLLWALIPGLPIDCPRWLNEGLAELVSGKLAGDDNGWKRAALISAGNLVPLHVVSPAFSWPDRQVEWHAREAAALLIDLHGEVVFRGLIRGLRFARPFYSVYPILTGCTFESFERAWLEIMNRNRVAENMPAAEIASRTQWVAENRRLFEFQYLLADLPERLISKAERERLTGIAKLHEAKRYFAAGKLNFALGLLNRVSAKTPGFSDLHSQLITAVQRDQRNHWRSELPSQAKASPNISDDFYSNLRVMHPFFAWSAAILFAAALAIGYLLARQKILPWLVNFWTGANSRSLAFRWLVTGFTGLAGSWFLRFLIVSMIPYSGLAAIDDLYRIVLAETASVFFWLALAWQLNRWEKNTAMIETLTMTISRGVTGSHLFFLMAVAAVPPLLGAWQNGWFCLAFSPTQQVLALLVLVGGAGAFSLSVWKAAMRWNRTSNMANHAGPAFIYALFRGGLFADPWGNLFAFVVGYRLSQLVTCSKSIWLAFIADVAFMLPALLISTGWFPAVDPVAGIWRGGRSAVVWWIIPALVFYRWQITRPETSGQTA